MAQSISKSERTPFYLMQSDHLKCEYPTEAQTEIVATESVTKQEYGVKWTRAPSSCIILKKYRDKSISSDFLELANWLTQEKEITVYVEPEVHDQEFPQFEAFDVVNVGVNIDFIVVLGGDGTLLYLASLFQKSVSIPPIISFARGSLGFLTPFEFKNHRKILNTLTTPSEPHWVSIRMRLRAKVFRRRKIDKKSAEEIHSNSDSKTLGTESIIKHLSEMIYILGTKNGEVQHELDHEVDPELDEELTSEHGTEEKVDNVQPIEHPKPTKPTNIYDVSLGIDDRYHCVYDKQALNEVLIERNGRVTAMIMLELHVNRKPVTTVQADGLIISTPTGSTAYSVSAGGSLIAPNVPCIGLTPICPHTLSFRPVVVADSSVIHVNVHQNARTLPKITLDGKFPLELERGDIIQIEASKYPVPTFKLEEFQHEWWTGLVEKFNWNVREIQK